MRRSNRRRNKLMSDINVVPYIDVMLVLLIIFMVTAPLLSQGVKVNLPKAQAKVMSDTQNSAIILSVNQRGDYFLNISASPKESIKPSTLSYDVQKAMKANPKRKVYVKGDSQVDYGQVVKAMVLLQKAGAVSVGLITKPTNTDL